MRTPQWLALVLLVVLVAPLGAAQDQAERDGGILLRLDGDVTVGPNETVELLVLMGDGRQAHIAGTAGVVVIVGGSLNLTGTIRDQLVLVDAHARLANGSAILGDVSDSRSTLEREPGSRIDGAVREGRVTEAASLFWLLFGIVFLIGVPVALVVAGLAAAWLFPRQTRRAGRTLTRSAGATVLTTFLVWLVLPLVAFVLLFTLVGLPTGLAFLLVFLPLLWVAGLIVSGIRIGDLLLTRRGRPPRARPLLSAFLGMLVLFLAAVLPFIGGLILFVAGMLGGGALLLAAYRAARDGTERGRNDRDEHPWDPSAGGA